jgi:hypothetical protein
MARPSTLDSQKDNDVASEIASEHDEHVASSRVSECKERRLTFDPDDLAELEGLEEVDMADDINLKEFLALVEGDPKMLYKVMAGRWNKQLIEFEQSIDRMKNVC